MGTLLVQPPGAGEQHELDVREVERRQRPGDTTLPAQRGMPEQEPRAVVRMERSDWTHAVSRASARSTNAARVCGKSPLISGPICGPSVSACTPLISIR